jgi:hypothetical protein
LLRRRAIERCGRCGGCESCQHHNTADQSATGSSAHDTVLMLDRHRDKIAAADRRRGQRFSRGLAWPVSQLCVAIKIYDNLELVSRLGPGLGPEDESSRLDRPAVARRRFAFRALARRSSAPI